MKISVFVKALLLFGFLISFTNCGSEKAQTLDTGWYYLVQKNRVDLVEKIKKNTQDTFYLNPIPVVTVPHFKEVVIYSGMTGKEGMQVVMNEEGTKLWAEATKLYARNYMGFVLDNELIHVQRIAAQNLYGTTTLNEKWFNKKYLEATSEMLNQQISKHQPAAKSETSKKSESSK